MRLLPALITGTELTLLLAVIVLEYLSGYYGGLMHHLYFKKRFYLATLYSEKMWWLHLLLLGLSLSAIIFFSRFSQSLPSARLLTRYILVLITLFACAFLPWFRQFNTAAHLLIALEICLVLETCRLTILPRTRTSLT